MSEKYILLKERGSIKIILGIILELFLYLLFYGLLFFFFKGKYIYIYIYTSRVDTIARASVVEGV